MEKSIRFVTVRVIDKQPPPLSPPSPLGIIAASIDISGDQKSAQPHGVHMPQTKHALVTRSLTHNWLSETVQWRQFNRDGKME